MKTKQRRDHYPTLSVRISDEQKEYLRREASLKCVGVPEYVRAVLFPFEIPDDKK